MRRIGIAMSKETVMHAENKTSIKGFTLIEAIIAMMIFGIAFTGLYLVFGIALKGANNIQARMHLNLIANQIVESIASETSRDVNDILNPFKTPSSYNANLKNCATFAATDVRNTWCTKLNEVVGGHQGLHANQKRNVLVSKASGHLYVDINLAVGGDASGNNIIQVVVSRRIRP